MHIVPMAGNAARYRHFLPAAADAWLQSLIEALTTALAAGCNNHALPKPLQRTAHGKLHWPGDDADRGQLPCSGNNQQGQLSSRYRKLPRDTARGTRSRPVASLLGRLTDAGGGQHDADGGVQRMAELMNEPGMLSAEQAPLRHNWECFMYTDGSLLQ